MIRRYNVLSRRELKMFLNVPFTYIFSNTSSCFTISIQAKNISTNPKWIFNSVHTFTILWRSAEFSFHTGIALTFVILVTHLDSFLMNSYTFWDKNIQVLFKVNFNSFGDSDVPL